MLTLLVFLGVLALLILAHELGHYLAARAVGVKVLEVGFGFPPRIAAFRKGDTDYSVNLIPMGGFVKLLGEDDPTHPHSLLRKGVPARFLVFSAGVLFNAILPIILFTTSFMLPKDVLVGQVQVAQVMPDSPAARAGIVTGDIILRVNGRPVRNTADLQYNLYLNLGRQIEVVLGRGRFTQEVVTVTPRWRPPAGEGPTGIVVGMANAYPMSQSYPFWEALPKGARATWESLVLARNEVASWFLRRQAPQMAGPVGIAQMTGEVARVGLAPLLNFIALLSINLAILNLLPIPILDGGKLFFLLLEVLRGGKRLSPQRENLANIISLLLIIALVFVVSYFDIIRALRGEGGIR